MNGTLWSGVVQRGSPGSLFQQGKCSAISKTMYCLNQMNWIKISYHNTSSSLDTTEYAPVWKVIIKIFKAIIYQAPVMPRYHPKYLIFGIAKFTEDGNFKALFLDAKNKAQRSYQIYLHKMI